MRRLTMVSMAVMLFGAMLVVAANAQAPSQPQAQALGDYARTVRKDKPQAAPAKKFDNDNLPLNDTLSVVGPAPAAEAQPAPEAAKPAEAPAPAAEAKASEQEAKPVPVGTDPESLGKPSAPVTAGAQPAAQDAAKADTAKADSPDAPKPDPAAAPRKSESKEKAEAEQKANEQWQKKIAEQRDRIDLISRDLDVTQREYHLRAAAFVSDAGNRLRNAQSWDQEDTKYKQQIEDKQKELESAKQKLEDMQEEARKSGVPSSMRE